MTYYVVIEQDGETARLECQSYAEAQQVKVSFENYGKCQNISIEQDEEEHDELPSYDPDVDG